MNHMRGKPFEPGNKCGRGRPQGSRNRTTIALQHMLDGHGEAITKKCALMAMQGNPVALRLCMDRLLAPRKEPAAKFRLAPVTTAGEAAAALDAVLQAVAAGRLTPAEGEKIAAIVEGRRRVIETEEHEARLQAVESKVDLGPTRPVSRKGSK